MKYTFITRLALLAALGSAAPVPVPQADSAASVYAPPAGTTWQISLSEPIDATQALVPDVSVYDVDLYDTPAESFAAFKTKGKKVICYFSAGSYEPGRPDSGDFQPADLGSVMDGWPDEKWINVKSANVRSIMSKRIALAKQKGCDGVDPDNVDGYGNSNGLGLTQADAVDYLKFLASAANSNGLAIGLKNAGDIVGQTLSSMQFAVVEQCHQYSECELYKPFIQAGKPVFNIEYPAEAGKKLRRRHSQLKKRAAAVSLAASAVVNQYCASSATNSDGFSVVIKTLALDQSLQSCPAVPIVGALEGATPSVPNVPLPLPSTPSPEQVSPPSPTPSAESTGPLPMPAPGPFGAAPWRFGRGRGKGNGDGRGRNNNDDDSDE